MPGHHLHATAAIPTSASYADPGGRVGARMSVLAIDAGTTGVTALVVTDQRETAVLWCRRTLQSARRAIVWQYRRTTGVCARRIDAGHKPGWPTYRG